MIFKVLLNGMLVNKDLMSKLAIMTFLGLILRLESSVKKEKESLTTYILEEIRQSNGTSNLASL